MRDLRDIRDTLRDFHDPPAPSARPKTAMSDVLLAREMESLGLVRKGEKGRASSLRRQGAVDRQDSHIPEVESGGRRVESGGRRVESDGRRVESDGRRVEVEEKSVRWDRATLVVGEGGEESAGLLGGRARGGGPGRTELLLSKEQEELSQSLSSAKFQLLRNVNLERVKAEHRIGQQEDGVVVRRVEENRSATYSRTFEDMPDVYSKMPDVYSKMPENVYAEMPTNTFEDISNDVFEDIPRAVIVRQRSRDRLKTAQTRDSEAVFDDRVPESYSPSAPLEEIPNPEHAGFIAMLFSGPNLPRNQRQQDPGLEKDFMFALFIQKQEEATSMSGAPMVSAERDPTVGHFCAPFCPGFCEANLCIFHTSN